MDERTRIEKDIVMFKKNLQKINGTEMNEKQKNIIELASQYNQDSKYYLEK